MSANATVIALFIAALIGGALIAAQGPIYTRMAGDLGSAIRAAFFAFLIGTLALGAMLVLTKTGLPSGEQLGSVPLWVWPGGLIGVFVVIVSIFAVPRLGVAQYSIALIAGQIVASHSYDATGAFGLSQRSFSTANLIGLALLGVGVWLTTLRN